MTTQVSEEILQNFVNKNLADEFIESKESYEEILVGDHSVRLLVDIFYSRGASPSLKLILFFNFFFLRKLNLF